MVLDEREEMKIDWIKKFIKKIRQVHCEHDWQLGIAEYGIQHGWRARCNVPFYEGELVTSDELGAFKGMKKICKKCGKSEDDEEVQAQVFGQVIRYVS